MELGLIAIFVGIPWILASAFKAQLNHLRFMRVLQLKSEWSVRLLDRAAGDPHAMQLLRDETQQQIFDVKIAEPGLPAPYQRVITSVQAACVLLAGGIALLVTRAVLRSGEQVLNQNDSQAVLFLGTLGVALGIGALVSAAAVIVMTRIWRDANAPR